MALHPPLEGEARPGDKIHTYKTTGVALPRTKYQINLPYAITVFLTYRNNESSEVIQEQKT
jgi:hypothetical protein